MLTNKDIRVENGNIVLNGDKYPLDGQSPEAIMKIVEDNSDTTPTENSDAPITSGGVFTALAGKEDKLTFDTAPTAESVNPVTSAGIKTYVDDAVLQKLTLVESKETSSGDSLTLDTTLDTNTMYLVAMSAPVSAAERRMRFSMIRVVNTTTNEIYFGSSDYTLSVSSLKLSISSSGIAYGIKASLIKLE